MGTIRIAEVETLEWTPNRDRIQQMRPEMLARYSAGELDSDRRGHSDGSDTEPQLFEVRLPADVEAGAHAHDRDEMMYIVDGEMHVGNRVLRPGSSMFISANTLYSFRSGPNGLHFLNFRPQGGARYIFKEDFLAERASS